MNTKTRLTISCILCICFALFLFGCKEEIETEPSCIDDLSVDIFHFLGRHVTQSVEYYDKKEDYFQSFSNATVTFNNDQTFSIEWVTQCDSALSSPPVCDSISFATGQVAFRVEGTWDFDQRIVSSTISCGGLFGPKTCEIKEMRGNCYLTVENAGDFPLDRNDLNAETFIDCAWDTPLYRMGIDLPATSGDRIRIQTRID